MSGEQVKRVLVVDDEVHITSVVSLKLRNAGYDVTVAGDGEEALELCNELQPHLVITDLQMPYMSGLDLCKKLKTQSHTQDIPALMLTARGYALASDDLAVTNVKMVMSKPFSPKEVLKKTVELIGEAGDGAHQMPEPGAEAA